MTGILGEPSRDCTRRVDTAARRVRPRRADSACPTARFEKCAKPRRHSMALRLQQVPAMKKSTTNKLTLRTQVIRLLTSEALARVDGGNPEPVVTGFIMKDTIIIRTGTR
jgi:hypothetical protein